MKILNLTQHLATEEQLAVGVVDLSEEDSLILKKILTFDEPPSYAEMMEKAYELVYLVQDHGMGKVMIGGAPWFMGPLETALSHYHISFCYSFSKRISVDLPNGEKISKFKHLCFVPKEKGLKNDIL